MSWELRIHIIDVGQGESSLIIARQYDDTTGALQLQRSILIDAGLPVYAQTVHSYITDPTKGGLAGGVDHILISHYDDDHSGGVIALLSADNFYQICKVIGQAAIDAADQASTGGNGHLQQVAAAAAAAMATIKGAYANHKSVAEDAGKEALKLNFPPNTRDDEAARQGGRIGESWADSAPQLNVAFIPTPPGTRENTKNKLRNAAQAVARSAVNATLPPAPRLTAASDAAFDELESYLDQDSHFKTNGVYRNVHIIDIGQGQTPPGNYEEVVDKGKVTYRNKLSAEASGLERLRTSSPKLGAEVLWKSGHEWNNPGKNASQAAPANAPAIFVVSSLGYIWKAPQGRSPISIDVKGNALSIGLIVRFNTFFYYTAGDLPSAGDELIADAIMKYGLPDPQKADTTFALPHGIACFKCGHHGANTSTSSDFLKIAKPQGAFISCETKYEHPGQRVIDSLHDDINIKKFYLTNCAYVRTHIPASDQNSPYYNDELGAPGNKSRVCGDNANVNTAVGRQRGDIQIWINQAESSSNVTVGPLLGQVLRQYHVRYYENDGAVQNFRVEDTIF
jgi:ribonuclease BN (tRNA processing enzyme)